MKNLRAVLSAATVLLLGLGYAGSQAAAMQGEAANWASRIDSKAVANLALVLLVAAIILSFVRDREELN